MAVNITQSPPGLSLSQSPMIFTVAENGDEITSSSYQYICELTYGRGAINEGTDGEATYTLEKYPNQSGVGMFDVSRILNSQFQSLALVNLQESVLSWSANFYGRWKEGNDFVTSSQQTGYCCALTMDGWLTPKEGIYLNLSQPEWFPYFPLLTDGPATQSVDLEQYGEGLAVASLANWTYQSNTWQPEYVKYESNLGVVELTINQYNTTYEAIQRVPIAPRQLPGVLNNNPNLEWFSIQVYDVDDNAIGSPIRYEVKCPTKYDNIQIVWINRYGAPEYFNFDLVHRTEFQTKTKEYKRQLGQWESPIMDSFHQEPSKQNYNTDVIQRITVNSDWVDESYNNYFKQMLVSNELAFLDLDAYDTVQGNIQVIPISVVDSSVQLKTQEVDKLIQYSFTFEYAQDYKLQF